MAERVVRLGTLLAVAISLLVVRLIHLQLIQGGRYRQLAEQNRLRLVPDQAPRGLVTDRRGRVLAGSQTIFRLTVVPQDVEDFAAVFTTLSSYVRRSPEQLRDTFRQARSLAFLPATVVSRVPKETALRLEEARWRLPGVLVKPETVRRYPMGQTAAHLLGYLSEPTPEELPVLKAYGVRQTPLVGRMGLERSLDHMLRGRPGGVMVEVNNRARQVRVVGRRLPEPGAQIALTVDGSLQSLIEQAFGDQPGAGVVLDPDSGEVLAMVSVPAFPPEAFSSMETASVRRLLADTRAPLLNRATMGVYQPGSIMKLVTAAAALEHRLVTPSTTVVCPGAVTIGDRTFHCWNRDGHGPMTLTEALMQSCNVYFIQVGRRLGSARLLAAMERVGVSHRTGWPLAVEERAGHLPRRRLTQGEVGLLAIGQGEILVTPLQAAILAAAFANGGTLVEPWVVSVVGEHAVSHPAPRRRIEWAADTLEVVRRGMREVVRHPHGTGIRAASPRVSIAGKTGTAQTGDEEPPHGWFIGFCPVDRPRAALAVVAEHGGSGGALPAEIAKAICEYVTAPETL